MKKKQCKNHYLRDEGSSASVSEQRVSRFYIFLHVSQFRFAKFNNECIFFFLQVSSLSLLLYAHYTMQKKNKKKIHVPIPDLYPCCRYPSSNFSRFYNFVYWAECSIVKRFSRAMHCINRMCNIFDTFFFHFLFVLQWTIFSTFYFLYKSGVFQSYLRTIIIIIILKKRKEKQHILTKTWKSQAWTTFDRLHVNSHVL